MIDMAILEKLNDPSREIRLKNLREIAAVTEFPEAVPRYINNHIHTTYSFSPYSPTAAVYAARMEGLCTAGIIDHDSIAGAREFIDAAAIIGMPVTVGMECRVSMRGTALEGLRTNNPDQIGVSYMTIQSVPHDRIEELQEFFAPYREARNKRNKAMTERICQVIPGMDLDFERDVMPLSMCHDGGSITERHLMYALAIKMTRMYGKGDGLIKKLEELGLELSEKQKAQLGDISYPFYEYDLLGILKSAFVPMIFIDADEECPALKEMVELCCRIDAYLCYAYLGDVGDSVTGDKKAQKFEDDHLQLVFDTLKDAGVGCITYMPTRNTPQQLDTLRELCRSYDMFEISGEDINSPRQSFIIKAMEDERFSNLIDATWKLIEHENRAGS